MKRIIAVYVCAIVAMVLIFAIYYREDVKLNIKFWGADVSLEVIDR